MDICKYHIVGAIVLSTCLQSVLPGDIDYQFQYQCYGSLCTYPLEYCSSVEWERRCIPCLPSVCQSKEVPLACRFNCSFKGETLKNSSEIVIEQNESESTTENTAGSSLVLVALIVLASLLVIVFLPAVFLAVQHLKLKQTLRNKTIKCEEMEKLLESAEQERKTENPSPEKDCYGKRKLTDVNPTDTDTAGCYKPTTYKNTVSQS